MATQLTRKPRVDAERHRARIIEVAREAFSAEGLDVPVREVARRSQLGVATLYRHFPTRQDLTVAVLADSVAECERLMQQALAEPDAAVALEMTFRGFSDRQVRQRGLNEAILGTHVAGMAFADQRRSHAASFALLVERASNSGVLRDGVTLDDARVALMAIVNFRVLPSERAGIAIGRLTDVLLAGLLAGD